MSLVRVGDFPGQDGAEVRAGVCSVVVARSSVLPAHNSVEVKPGSPKHLHSYFYIFVWTPQGLQLKLPSATSGARNRNFFNCWVQLIRLASM